MKASCIVVAAGASRRYGKAKLLETLGNTTVLERSIVTAQLCVDHVVVVCDTELREGIRDKYADVLFVKGGPTRSDSVRSGLRHVDNNSDVIIVHDAARPLASPRLYSEVIAAVRNGADAAVPGIPVINTLKLVERNNAVVIARETLPREDIFEVQTPQAFRADALRLAHIGQPVASDDADLVERQGGRVIITEGDFRNIKLTVATDLRMLQAYANEEMSTL